MATHMHPPMRAILHKKCLKAEASACKGVEEASVVQLNSTGTRRGEGGEEVVVVLADPVVALALPSGEMDPVGTVAAVCESAKHRQYFWVFVDHRMSAAALEVTLDLLVRQSAAEGGTPLLLLSVDELIRVYLRDRTAGYLRGRTAGQRAPGAGQGR